MHIPHRIRHITYFARSRKAYFADKRKRRIAAKPLKSNGLLLTITKWENTIHVDAQRGVTLS